MKLCPERPKTNTHNTQRHAKNVSYRVHHLAPVHLVPVDEDYTRKERHIELLRLSRVIVRVSLVIQRNVVEKDRGVARTCSFRYTLCFEATMGARYVGTSPTVC